MKTHLEDKENNRILTKDISGKVEVFDVISSINFRIARHRDFIKRDEDLIKNNSDCDIIVFDAIERILERKAKIGELQEFVKYSF